jgi:putative hemolysin
VERRRSEISLAAIWKKGATGRLLALVSPLLNLSLGVTKLRHLYERDGLQGLEPLPFIERFLEKEGIRYSFDQNELSRIATRGPVILVANHPMGGLEGIVLMWLLRLVRPDYKVFVNVMDSFLVELEAFFIFTNPMAKGSAANLESIRRSRDWLAEGHCLLVFPAGRVGLYRPEKGYVTDEPWDSLPVSLALMTKASIVPIFVEGESSPLFSFLSREIYPMKLLYLLWEFLGSFDNEVVLHVGRPIAALRLAGMGRRRARALLRMRCYLECPAGAGPARRDRGAGSGILHPEVEEYLERYSLSEAELSELAEALAGSERKLGQLLRLAQLQSHAG